jgi:putative ABC transport system permease protein
VIARLTWRGVLAHKWRMLLTVLAVVSGVAFVSGSFILTDSLRRSFDSLFSEIAEGIDLEVRSSLAFGDAGTSERDPIPLELVDVIAAVPGVATAEGNIQRFVTIIDSDGEAYSTGGAPTFGNSWSPNSIGGTVLLEGDYPTGPNEMAMDKATSERVGYELGDTVTVVGSAGKRAFILVGLAGRGDSEGFGGAAITLYDLATADDFLAGDGKADTIDLAVEDGASVDQVAAAIQDVLPPNLEVVTGQQVADEIASDINSFVSIFGNVLLGFAGVALFVSAFLIFNTFAIIVSQRLRELALMRAVGADAGQVKRMIVGEAFIVGVIATVLGIGFGILVAKAIVALFNAAGAGFPSAATVLSPRTVIVAIVIGMGVTVAAAVVPALRAARIPPVAAMRPEIGFTALQTTRRLVTGAVMTIVGLVLFAVGVFIGPGGTIATLILAGGGAVLLFIGIASLSTLIARRVAGAIGAPIAAVFGVPGRLARDNTQRTPRRTASTAAALMIGLALVSLVSVVGTSVKATFIDQLDTSVTADFFITDKNFTGLPPAFAIRLAELEELDAVSPFRAAPARIAGETKQIGAVDPVSFGRLVDIGIVDGAIEDLVDGGLLLHTDPATDLGVTVGDTVEVQWQNGQETTLEVKGVYADSSVAGNWLTSVDTIAAVTEREARDFFIGARIADGVAIETARDAVEAVATDFPSAQVQDQAEFRQSQEDQLDQILSIIYGLLAFAIFIAVIGIANTMALSVFERTREFGLLRAVGMNRRQLRRAIRWESVIVSVFGALLGIIVGLPLGVGVAIALPDTVVSQIAVPWSTIVVILLVSVVVGLVAAILPARRAARIDILQAIAAS